MANNTMRNLAIFLVVLLLGATAAYFQFGDDTLSAEPTPAPSTTTNTDTNTIAIDTGIEQVSAEGVITPQAITSLAFSVNGTVADLQVALGASVQVGDPLIQLQSEASKLALTGAETGLAQAQINLDKAHIGVTVAQTQLDAATAGHQAALIGVEAAQAQMDLVASGPISEELSALQANIDAATAIINQAAANRDVALAGPTSAQIEAAQAQVALARAEELALQIQYDDIIRNGIGGPPEETLRFALFASEANLSAAQTRLTELQAGTNAPQRQAAQATVSVAIAQRDIAQAQLALAEVGARAEEILIAEINVHQAQSAVDQALVTIAQAEALLAQATASVAEAETAVTTANTAIHTAQLALADLTLHAPIAGRVVELNTNVGEFVTAATPLIVIISQDNWLVKTTDLTEIDVVTIAVGHPVNVYIDAIPQQKITGIIKDIAATPTLVQGDVTYAVTIELEDTSTLPLRWGMTASIDIQLDEE